MLFLQSSHDFFSSHFEQIERQSFLNSVIFVPILSHTQYNSFCNTQIKWSSIAFGRPELTEPMSQSVGERFCAKCYGCEKYALIDRHYFLPLLSSFESYLLPFLPFILDLVEAGFGFICVNLYCRLSIFLIYRLFSFINNNHFNYTTEDRWPPRSICYVQLQPRHEMAIQISSCQLFLQH